MFLKEVSGVFFFNNSNIVKYYFNLKQLFSILMYFKM